VIRLLLFLVTGLLFAISGLYIGLMSHQATYHTVGKEIVAHFLSGNGSSSNRVGYLQMVNDNNLYIINENNFSPNVKDNSFGDGDTLSFTYRTTDTDNINVSATNTSTHLLGPAYTVEQFSVFPSSGSSGQGPRLYTSAEYGKNPHGFYVNRWTSGAGPLALGLILIAVGFILRGRNKKQTSLAVVPPSGIGAPIGQLQVNMLPPPSQNPTPYPNPVSYPPYRPQLAPSLYGNNMVPVATQDNQPPPTQYPLFNQPQLAPPSYGSNAASVATQNNQSSPTPLPKPQFKPRPGQFKSPPQYNQPPHPHQNSVSYPQIPYPPQSAQYPASETVPHNQPAPYPQQTYEPTQRADP
jgi:hypothetical protein